jgi:DNA-directed RNA polymerase specialized sigma24 family protein
MTAAESDERLSRIVTQWTAVLGAHAGAAGGAESVRNRLLLRYSGAAYRYLLGAVRDPDAAAELCQEFAVRFLRGDFRRADPSRGRFRDYVKAALSNLATDYHRARQAAPRPLAPDAPDPAAPAEPSSDDFLGGWREAVLDQAWEALARDNPGYHAALLLRVREPDLSSAEMAARLTEQLGKPMTPENVRKMLQRGHARFADLLLDQVAASLDEDSGDELEDELKALDLLRYCRSALDRRRKKG